MPYCRQCGIEVGPSTFYCPDCGEELNFGPSPTIEEVTREETTAEETETDEPEHDTQLEPAFTVADESEELTHDPVEETVSESEESPSIGIIAKVIAVICVPIAAAGIILEILSVLSLATGGYTVGEFILAFIIFGFVTVLPSAYLYYIYRRWKEIRKEGDE